MLIFCIFLQEHVWYLQCYTGWKKNQVMSWLFVPNSERLFIYMTLVWGRSDSVSSTSRTVIVNTSEAVIAIRQKGPSLLLWPHGQPTPTYSTDRSITGSCIMVWYTGCTAADKIALQVVIKTAHEIIGCPLSFLEVIASSCCRSRAKKILSDQSDPGQSLLTFNPLAGGTGVLGIEQPIERHFY